MTKLGICGLGLIGRQRLNAALTFGLKANQICIYDPKILPHENSLDNEIQIFSNFEEFVAATPNRVIVSTPHHVTLPIIESLIGQGTHILMEKPMGRNLSEAEGFRRLATPEQLSVGFNFRFMKGIQQLKFALENNLLGQLNSIRFDLGHGGAPGDQDSWKLHPTSAGGGALLDPGIHLLDLLLYLFDTKSNEIKIDGGNVWSGFWKTGIEESVNVVGTVKNIPFNMSVSIVAWRTRFRIEAIGSDAYMKVDGRGRSDGPQTLTRGERWAWQSGVSQIDSELTEVVMEKDDSLIKETHAWLKNSSDVANSADGLAAMNVYNNIKVKVGF